MAQPPAYNVTTDFSATPGQDRIPAASLDVELQNLQTTIAALRTNIALIQRDDGALRDGSVTSASLAAGLLADLIQDLQDYAPQTALAEAQTATEGQTAFTLATATYSPGLHNLGVYVNGVRQAVGRDYAETSSSVVTFTSALEAGSLVDFYIDERGVNGDTVSAANVTFTQSGTGLQATSVNAHLRRSPLLYADELGVSTGSSDNAAALNAAITEARVSKRELVLPTGTLQIASGLTWASGGGHTDGPKIVGQGMWNTILRPTGNFTALAIDGTGTLSQFMHGGWLRDFAINPASSGNSSQIGLSLKSWWYGVVDSLRIQDLGGDGVYVPLDTGISTNPDDYASGGLTFQRCRIVYNDGRGVNAPVGLGFAGPRFLDCYVGENELGGYYLGGHGFLIEGGAIFSNGRGQLAASGVSGVVVEAVQTAPQLWRIRGVELDNNRTYHVHVKDGRGFEIVLNRCNSWETVFNDGVLSPAVHFKLGGGASTNQNGRLVGNQHRSQRDDQAVPASTMHPMTCYDFSSSANVGLHQVLNVNAEAADNTTAMTRFANIHVDSRNEVEHGSLIVNAGHNTGGIRARVTSAENIESSAAAIVFDSDQFDPHGLHNTSTGTYTAPATGLYEVDYSLRISGVADGTLITIGARISSGASIAAENQHRVNGTGSQNIAGRMVVYLTQGDGLQLYGSNSSGGAIALTTGTTATWWSVSLKG